MTPRVEALTGDSPAFDTVIGWHWREWSHDEPDADFDRWYAQLLSRSGGDGIPFTLVAYIESEPVGCLTVCHDDLDKRFADKGPWLSGMFVAGVARNLGVGRALLEAAESRVRALGASELWVFTSEAGPFYARCGYTYAHRKESVPDTSVLVRDLG